MKKGYKFSGKWICTKEFSKKGNTLIQNHLASFYKELTFPKSAKSFKIKISADDYYKLYINGCFVCQGPAPSYAFSYNFNERDITPYIRKGESNEIKVTVYYQGLINRVWVSGDGNEGMICDIYADGKIIASSDESWTYEEERGFLKGEITGYDTQFTEKRDFTVPASERVNCAVRENIYTFKAEPFPCVEIYPASPPIIKEEKDKIFFDFLQEMTGTMKIVAHSNFDGERLILHLGEETDEKGNVRYDMRCTCKYEDTYILKKGENIIDQFDYKAFRYGEILKNGNIKIVSIQMLVRHFPFPEKTYDFGYTDEKMNKVIDLCKNTVKYGTGEVYVDCPTREKGQYQGDVTVAAFSHLYLTGENRLLKSALTAFADSYLYSGEFLAVAPCSYKQKIADYTLQLPLNVLRYYEYTKDKPFLKDMLSVCEKICKYFSSFSRSDGLLSKVDTHWNLVDWPENLRDGYDFDLSDPIGDGCHNVINAFYIGAVSATEKIRDILGIEYINKSEALKKSFNALFFDEKTGLYNDSDVSLHSSLHGNCLPVYFGIYEKSDGRLTSFLKEKRLSCGTYMSYFYLSSLNIIGQKDFAKELITSGDEHSWFNMIKEGATTCFEAWGKEQKWNTSLFHPWSTAPLCVLYEEKENVLKNLKIFAHY